MTSPERWREMQRVLDGALDLAPESRAAFVTDACGTDSALREQVVRLLDACGQAENSDDFLASPATEFAAPMLADLTVQESIRRTALPETLATALASSYTIERELGHGGMASVFLARDLRHDRAVAVKVLARDLVAPAGVERFLQEIRVTARLSHPHLLPVHDSGEAHGLLYYVMPYVEGETLRARLVREGALPLPDAIRLLRELADALAFAHARGVVHRDLKPENILLSGGHAVVADFGIAKALATATNADTLPRSALASAGVALGTPAYMAPEQAVGNTDVDHRADLYALGVVAYELLAGVHPFGERSPQAMVMAHLSEAAPPLGDLRPGLPRALSALVMQCLGKDPAVRPASADAVLAALDDAPRAAAAPRYVPTRRAAWTGLALLGMLALTFTAYMMLGPGRSLIGTGVLREREPLLVADFSVTGPDSGIGPQLGHVFGRYLGESRVISILPESQVAAALRRMQRPARSGLDTSLAREVAQREGLRAVVEGELTPLGAGYLVTVRLVPATGGDELASFHATAARPQDLIAVLDRLGRKLRGRIGESLKDVRGTPPLDRMTTTSLEALRKYAEGHRLVDSRRALSLFREAIALDSTFATAHLALGIMLDATRMSRAARDSAYTRAYQLRDRLTEMERVAVTAFYWNFVGRDRNRSIAAYETQVARDSTDWRAILNLGLRLKDVREFARAESLTRRYAGIVGWRGTQNLVQAQIGQGKLAEATATWTLLQGRPDTLGRIHVVMASLTAALASLRFDSAEALAARWHATVSSPESRMLPMMFMARIARVRGRLAEANRITRESQAIRAAAGMMPTLLSESLDSVREDLWLRGKPAQALARLDALVAAHPIASLETLDDQGDAMEAAALYAVVGRADRARATLDAVMTAADSLSRRGMLSLREVALGEIALAEHRPLEAAAAFRRSDLAADGLPVSSCVVCILPRLARAAERAGWADSARIFWERYVTTTSLDREETDSWFLAMAYRRLGHLCAEAGDPVKAAEYDRRLAALWRGADTGLRLRIAASR